MSLNLFKVFRAFLFTFHAGSRGLGSKNFRNSSCKKKRPVRPVYPDYLSISYDYDETKVSNKVNDLIDSCEHYKKLDCLQDQLMSLSEKIKGIHNQILEFVHYPDQHQTCQEYSMKILK